MTDTDYLIVGAGSAGCVLADRLSADGRTRVTLVEAGDPDPERAPEVRVPALFHRAFGGPADWGFQTVPQRGLGGRVIPIPRGKGLGGSSAINAQLWQRGDAADYDEWSAAGLGGWGHDDVAPYFRRAEDQLRLAGLRYPLPVTADFVSACAQLGYAPAAERQEGYALARVTQRDGVRWSSADGYLRPALNRANLTVLTGALVRRVLFTGGRARGAELLTEDGVQAVTARNEVIIAAGVVGSPQLLMLSGIGPAAHLAEHGIPVLVDAPETGQNLTDHLVVPMAFAGVGFESPGAGAGQAEIDQYLKDRTGTLGSVISEAVLFLRTRAELAAPDVEIAQLVIPYGDHQREAAHGLALGVIALRPHSRSSVTLRSADPADAPALDPGYLTDQGDRDLRTAIAGIRRAQDILRQPVFAKWRAGPLTDGAMASADDRVADYVRATGLSIHHLVSTCRMGRDPRSVLDERCRVRGVRGLRVVDAAAMPSLVRAHTHGPVTMLAERASALIIADRAR